MFCEKTWVGFVTEKDYGQDTRGREGARSSYIRKKFIINDCVEKAILSISSLGIYHAKINGQAINEGLFGPGYTDTHHTILYDEVDVTTLLKQGENAIGVILGDGWYAGWVSQHGRNNYGDYPLKLWFELKVSYKNGTAQVVKTDGSECAGIGEVLCNDFYDGQVIDHREYKGDCSLVDFDDSSFSPVQTFNIDVKMVKNYLPIVKTFEPLFAEIIEQTDDSIVLDFKQNCAGILKLVAEGKRGSEIVIKYAEVFFDGDIYTRNLRKARATDKFILAGEGQEEFFPKFTYHGYRYAKIFKDTNTKIVSAITYPIHNDIEFTGKFECSNSLVNKIHEITSWSLRSNTVCIPTDCPQRDERMGWTGDSQAFCSTAMYLMNYGDFYRKHVMDMVDSTKGRGEEGLVCAFVPYAFQYGVADPDMRMGFAAWSDAIVIVPYNHYLFYGDKSILVENILAMKSHVDTCYLSSDDGVAKTFTYGEHVSVYEQTDRSAFATIYGAYTALLLSRICEIIGDKDGQKYLALYEKMKRAFTQKFIDKDGKIVSDTMTLYAEAYEFGIIDKDNAKKHLIRKLDQFDDHYVGGMFGTKIIFNVLCKLGLKERAFNMLTKKTFPSWGYMIENGATTLWELWDSIIDGKMNEEKVSMNSLNHYMLGGCVNWLYASLLGINPTLEGAGFNKVKIAPVFVGVDWAKGSYISNKGKILVEWQKKDGKIEYVVSLPKAMIVEFDFEDKILEEKKEVLDNSVRYVITVKG